MKTLILCITVFLMTISFSVSRAEELVKEAIQDPKKLAALMGAIRYCAGRVAETLEDQKMYDLTTVAVAAGLGDAIDSDKITYEEAEDIAMKVKYSGRVGNLELNKKWCEGLRKGIALVTLVKLKQLTGDTSWDPMKVAVLVGALRYCAGNVAKDLEDQKLYDAASLEGVNELQKAIQKGEVTWEEVEAVSMKVKYEGKVGDVELNKQRCEELRKSLALIKYAEEKAGSE